VGPCAARRVDRSAGILRHLDWERGSARTLFQWFDLVFVPIHEGGHLLFGYFGQWLMVAGGTLLQLFVPFALVVYFVFKRQLLGTTFCAFFFFEQFLPIGIYMADARCSASNT